MQWIAAHLALDPARHLPASGTRRALFQDLVQQVNSPLSPHLTWYRPQLTSVLSILHRAAGIVLALGSMLLVWWLVAVEYGGRAFSYTEWFLASPIGLLCLAGWSVAFFFHLSNGVRHLCWDSSYGFDIKTAYRSGYAVIASTAILSAATWAYVLLKGIS